MVGYKTTSASPLEVQHNICFVLTDNQTHQICQIAQITTGPPVFSIWFWMFVYSFRLLKNINLNYSCSRRPSASWCFRAFILKSWVQTKSQKHSNNGKSYSFHFSSKVTNHHYIWPISITMQFVISFCQRLFENLILEIGDVRAMLLKCNLKRFCVVSPESIFINVNFVWNSELSHVK